MLLYFNAGKKVFCSCTFEKCYKKPRHIKRAFSIPQNSSTEGLNHLIRIHVISIVCNSVKTSSGPAAKVYLLFTATDSSTHSVHLPLPFVEWEAAR